jgi:hypothetical protein
MRRTWKYAAMTKEEAQRRRWTFYEAVKDVVAVTRAVPEPVTIYQNLRSELLSLPPARIGIYPSEELPNVWGVLMETGYSPAVVTLVCLADGTTSLCFGNGGGVIGAEKHDAVRRATAAFIAAAETHRNKLLPAESFPLPDVDRVRFYVLTFSGTLTAEAGERELGKKTHELSALFYAGHDVITQIRITTELSENVELS